MIESNRPLKAALIITVLVFLIGPPLAVNRLSANRADVLRETQLASCERGNAVREVVFLNTRNAIRENHENPKIADVFRENLETLVEPEEVNDKTGLVHCEDAIPLAP